MSQMPVNIGEGVEEAAAEVLGKDVPPACCRLASRIPTDGAENANTIFEMALCEEVY